MARWPVTRGREVHWDLHAFSLMPPFTLTTLRIWLAETCQAVDSPSRIVWRALREFVIA